jgi:hypothetical protein
MICLFIALQVAIVICAAIVRVCDRDRTLQGVMPDWFADHEWTAYYVWGLSIFLVLVGLGTGITACLTDRRGGGGVGPLTDCGGCFNCGGAGEGAIILVFLLLIVLAIIVIIGLFLAAMWAGVALYRMMNNHARRVWRRDEVHVAVVRDRYGTGRV